MAVTLEQAQLLAPNAIVQRLIEEIRVGNLLGLLEFEDTAAITGRGGTTVYTYNRVKKGSGVSTRAIGGKYTLSTAEKEQFNVLLSQLGGKFEIDRIIGKHIGPRGAEEAFQMRQKIQAAQSLFNKLVIHGDRAVDPNGFDGLDKALVGATKQVDTEVKDWSLGVLEPKDGLKIVSDLDNFNSALQGRPGAYLGHQTTINRIKAAARVSNMYTQQVGPLNSMIDFYGTTALLDLGEFADADGNYSDILPVRADGTSDLFAVQLGLNGFHGVSAAGGQIIDIQRPNYDQAEEQVYGMVEVGPVGVALQSLKAAAKMTVKVRPAAA